MDSTCRNIVTLAEGYAAFKGLAASTISRKAMGSGDMVERLRAGRQITTVRAARVIQWFSDHWPDDDLKWPDEIPRPPRTEPHGES